MNMTFDFSWLNDFFNNLPEKEKIRKNFFEIAGFPKRETVNSNMLAFYFNKYEEHKFNSLFYDSLIEIISNKLKTPANKILNQFENDYTIEREFKNIDLLIQAEEKHNSGNKYQWAIIIENKIGANLYNDLKRYWNSVKAKHKIGVALTIKPLSEKEQAKIQKLKAQKINFVHITHNELIKQVIQNLHLYYIKSDDRHLLFLKEYIANINLINNLENFDPNMEKSLKEYQNYIDKINKLSEIEMELRRFVSNNLFSVLEKFGFITNSKNSSKTKHFYPDEEYFKDNKLTFPEEFRIWINIDDLLKENTLHLYFELYDDYTVNGTILKTHFKNKLPKDVYIGEGGRDGGTYNQIFGIYKKLSNTKSEKKSLSDKLEEILKATLFNSKNNLVEKAKTKLDKITSKK